MSDQLLTRFKFDRDGLLPAIVQDAVTGEVLTLAYMNEESLARTLQSGETWFWSRSRKELWHKGATSGNKQRVADLRLDCDGDAVLVRVHPAGPACHTGARTCFHQPHADEIRTDDGQETTRIAPPTPDEVDAHSRRLELVNMPAMELGILLQDLFLLIQERRDERPPNSYTTYLFNSGLDKILKKVGEEAAETIIAAKNEGTRDLTSEISDLLYHLLVLMAEREVSLRDIVTELGHRAGRQADPKYNR
ncbi:MAG: bifunctional phosphoribosyl-AMP cyclohydrolase/phosphoribosyl-ATP diphosphatase HisIE [Blastocatellales bacterium]|nr:bifunctional phosphoribosyl-AMP cyclohydrolase/phosphoribosyl-ATP diphosphatase HisIE [Blastocatellales bacterium]